MNATQWAAWIGASTGVVSFFWNVYVKLTSDRPKLQVQAFAEMIKIPAPKGNPRFMRGTIRNVGSAPTTITNYALFGYRTRWERFRDRPYYTAVLNAYEGSQAPVKLEVGNEANVLLVQDKDFNEMVKAGDFWFVVFHAFSNKPTMSKILGTSKDSSKPL